MEPKYEANVDKTLTPRKIFIRQILVSSSVWSSFFMFGLCMGTPTIYISQTREEANSTDVISNEMSSWISSAYNYSAIPNLFIVAFLSRKFGRKKTFLFASLTSAVGFVTLYLSSNVTQVIISEILQGTLIASDGMICVMVLTEYTSPKYRGFFLTFKSATFGWGMLVANTMGTFLHWKSIPLLGFILSVYAFLSCLVWPESPYWLASRQNYEACAKSHCWLKGTDEESMKEISSLIMQHKDLSHAKIESQNKLKKIQIAIASKAFYKPFGYTMLMLLLYYFSGKMSCNVYALQLIKNVTNSESTAYTGMLVVDALTVFTELCPLRYRGLYMLLMELVDNIIMGTVVKILPFLLSTIGAHGAFFFYGNSSLILTLLIYYFIPETKDKTIIEMVALMGT
ncbi:unnamed protein product [Pieris brassicae]|uniref:Major facilitator superfamily (MFS) profile domain-containing protein n=1 Tax=Pieris brassicae TaxID=7116 RepID=A0A9P0X608_PIEBR|nr:unnamed protein product [Pieris brassicae]